ncbi:BadF/BadG/BcrA/BcrD ATPase family protein [Metabacillus sp. SLBN-84]
MNNSSFPLLAVDGGGTKTLAVIADSKGNVLTTGRSSASNYQVTGVEGAKQSIFRAIGDAVKKLGIESERISFQTGVFALAGIDTSEDEVIVKRLVTDVNKEAGLRFEKLIIENDALSTLIGATKNKPGALVISGTGSIAFAHDGKGSYVRSGGWGHTVGDEGSGYWIGLEAIRAILKMSDGRGSDTLLKTRVLDAFDLKNVESLYNWVYSTNSSVEKIGSISQTVEACAFENDAVARRILDQAADELYSLLETVINKTLEKEEPNIIVLQGGILKHNDYIRKQLEGKVKSQFPKSCSVLASLEPFQYIVQRGLLKN